MSPSFSKVSKVRARVAGIIAGILAAVAALAQAPDAGPTVRVTVDLVQVDATVTDPVGRHVPDLKAEDFRILEDGKPQKITAFSYVRTSDAAAPPQPVNRTAEAARLFIPPEPPRRESVHRTIVLMADDLGLSAEVIPGVKSAMKSFVDREMRPGDLVSVMKTSGGMGVAEELTVDKRHLEDAIDHLRFTFGRNGILWYTPVRKGDASSDASKFEDQADAHLRAARASGLAGGTATALADAILGLRDMPGRKAIALFSEGIPGNVGAIAELANRASVVIYTIDPRGLALFNLTAVDTCMHCSDISRYQANRKAAYLGSQVSLDVLARATGGLFLHEKNDLDASLKTAMEDVGSYYLIGYQPHREDFEKDDGKPKYHTIEVKVLRPGLKVRSREGFLGAPQSTAAGSGRKSPEDELQSALLSPFQATGVPVRLSAYYSASWKRDPKTGRRRTVLRAMLAIDARALVFAAGPDGGKRFDLEVTAGAWDENGAIVASTSKTFETIIRPEDFDAIAESGLEHGFDIEVPRPGAYQLRIALRDRNSERLGSAHEFVEIPDFNRSALALSTIQLGDSAPEHDRALMRAGIFGAGSAVTRAFAPGSTLNYDCGVFGEAIDKARSAPALRMQVRIFRGSEQIYLSPPMPVPEQEPPRIRASGKINLAPGMAPGAYAVQLSVTDSAGKATHSAEQWTDFTLVQPGGEMR